MPRRLSPRRFVGIGILSLAVWAGFAATTGRHGNTLGLVTLCGALLGSMPGAIDGMLRPGLRPAALVVLGASLGRIVSLVVAAMVYHASIPDIVAGGLSLGLGAVIIVLVAFGSAITFFAPRRDHTA